MPLHEKQATKSKYINWSSSKLKTCALKDIIKKVERQHTNLEKISANHVSDKGLVSRI